MRAPWLSALRPPARQLRFDSPTALAAISSNGLLRPATDGDGSAVGEASGRAVLRFQPPRIRRYRVVAEVKLAAANVSVSLRGADGWAISLRGDHDDAASVWADVGHRATAQAGASTARPQRMRLRPNATEREQAGGDGSGSSAPREGAAAWGDHWFRLSLDVTPEETRAWLDGRLLGVQPGPAGSGNDIQLELNPGDRVRTFEILPLPDAAFLPVDIGAYFNNDALVGGDLGDGHAFADPALAAQGTVVVEGIPFHVNWRPGRPNNVDVGRTGYRGFQEYVGADAMSGDPGRVLLRVPRRYFGRAHFICVSDTERDALPAAALRMIKCGRGHAVTSEFEVPRWQDADGAGQRLDTAAGRLWFISVPLNPCDFQEFLTADDTDYLELDLTRLIALDDEKFPRPMGPRSAVHVFAMTLETAPAEMVVTSEALGNIFTRPQVPVLKVRLRSQRSRLQRLRLDIEVRDPYGRTSQHRRDLRLSAGGSETIAFSLPQRVNGKFDFRARLSDESGQRLLERRTTFALLPDWQRKARDESPFGMWCFFEAHLGLGPEVSARMMSLVGVRWTLSNFVVRPDPRESEERAAVLARHGIGLNGTLLCGIANSAWEGPVNVESDIAELRRQPATDTFQVFWEAYLSRRLLGEFPRELLGQPPFELTDDERQHLDASVATGLAYSKRAREAFPNAKLVFGNGFPSFIGAMLRAGYPRDYIDGFGLDFDLYTSMPERQPGVLYSPFNGLYYVKQMQKMYGYEGLPLYLTEAIYSPVAPGWVTERQQADYYVRAHLLGLAAGVRRFCMCASMYDPADSYAYGHYGPVALCHRPPELNPRESLCAYATMTAMLDQVSFEAMLPTGSPSVYAIRFRRRNGEPLHVFWHLRGQRPVTLRGRFASHVEATDLFGNVRALSTRSSGVRLELTGSPIYLTGISDITAIELGEPRHEPEVADRRLRTLARFASLDQWEQEPNRQALLEGLGAYAPLAPVKLDLAVSPCPSGPRLRVGLPARPRFHPLQTVYSALRRTGPPITLGEDIIAIGAWVDGNSCGGRVLFEAVDASGRRWLSGRARTIVDFDGRRCLTVELPHAPQGRRIAPVGMGSWVCEDTDAVPAYPLTLTQIIFEARSHVIRGINLEPVSSPAYYVERVVAVR